MVGIVLLGIFVVLLVFGAPIAVCLGMSSVGAILAQGAGKPLDAIMSVLPRLCSSASSKFVLLAIPFFILSGNVMEKAGISGRLINLAEKCLGHIRGGMAMVCVVVSCFFAAISGSGPATVAALGLIMIPALVKAGYPAAFSCALMAAGGAIGVVIGHEMTHGFDDQGRQFDKDGNMNNWWTDADAEAFKQKTDILVKQFDAIEVLPARGDQPAVFANGSLCLGENIADQGGLRVAYTALMNTLNGTEPEPIDGLTPAQRFYLSYATVWAQNIRDEEIARLTKLDVHSLGQWRVDATLRNLQDFFDAFNITDGKMYMPVEERVIIW